MLWYFDKLNENDMSRVLSFFFFTKLRVFLMFFFVNYIKLCSLYFIISRTAEGQGVSCFLSVSLSFDWAGHSGMRRGPTPYYTLGTRCHGPFAQLADKQLRAERERHCWICGNL